MRGDAWRHLNRDADTTDPDVTPPPQPALPPVPVEVDTGEPTAPTQVRPRTPPVTQPIRPPVPSGPPTTPPDARRATPVVPIFPTRPIPPAQPVVHHSVRGAVPSGADVRRQRRRGVGCAAMSLMGLACISCALIALLAHTIVHLPGDSFLPGVTLSTPQVLAMDQHPTPTPSPTEPPTATPPPAVRAPATATSTAVPTVTNAPSPTGIAATDTATAPPPTATSTGTPIPTDTPVPATATPTNTSVPPTVTPTKTAIPPVATPTATLVPGSGTIGATDQGKLEQPNPTLNGCPGGNGCDFADNPVSGSTTLSEQWTSYWQHQTNIQGTIVVTSQSNQSWSCNGDNCLTGNGYHCSGVNFTVPAGATINVWCVVWASSPSSLPPDTIFGIDFGQFSWRQPNTMWGNGGYVETQADCKAGLNDLANRAGPDWVSADFANKTKGQIVVTNQPARPNYDPTSWTCNPGVGAQVQHFTVSVNASYSGGLAFAPAKAQAAAQARLNAAHPSGWTYAKTSTCSPSGSKATGSTTLTTQCGDQGWAVYPWSASDKQGLSQAVAGQSQSQAIASCQAYPLVKQVTTGTCTASGAMPPDPSNITVSVTTPPAPFVAQHVQSATPVVAFPPTTPPTPQDGATPALAALLLLAGVSLALRRSTLKGPSHDA